MIDRIQRINWIDWSKVFAIYLVALGHLLGNTGMEGYLHNCIYLFHMPFFFFVSGYLLKSNDQKKAIISWNSHCFIVLSHYLVSKLL